jgi:hypothetical protein
MPDHRRCWIDTGVSPVFEAWVTDISDRGGSISVEHGQVLPETFTVYFDKNRLVGRTTTIKARNDSNYRVLFIGKAKPGT